MKIKKLALYNFSIYAGILLVLLGCQLCMVESYVLTPGTTRVLADWFGPPADTVEGVVQQAVIETTSPRKRITPPPWFRWAVLGVGVVLTANGIFGRWRK